MTVISDDTRQPRKSPSLLAANLYLLFGLIVLIVSSYAFQNVKIRYVVGIAVELALAAGALLFIRLEKIPFRQTLRLHWPGWRIVGLSGALAPGLWITGVILNLITTVIFGYTTPADPTMFPRTLLEAFLLLVATVIVAPLTEELIFRGYVQRAYEKRSPWSAIVFGGIIFALYHLRFQGATALIPVALALGFIVWRSNSLLPGILLHAAYNSIASVILIASSFFPMMVVGGLMLAMICLGFLMIPVTAVLLWLIWRWSDSPVTPSPPKRTGWRAWAWIVPLVLMAGIYGFAAYTEVLMARFPERLAVEELDLQAPSAWDTATEWRYVLQGGLSQTVGEANCDLTPQADSVTLTCRVSQDAFEAELPIDLPESFEDLQLPGFNATGAAYESVERIVWDKTDLALQAVDSARETETARFTLTTAEEGAILKAEEGDETQTTTLPPGAFLDAEWPWRLSALPFDLAYGSTESLVLVNRQGLVNVVDAFIVVAGSEPMWTPAGNFVTWRVDVTFNLDGEETTLSAWYEVDAPHTLVRYDNGEVSYLLDKVE